MKEVAQAAVLTSPARAHRNHTRSEMISRREERGRKRHGQARHSQAHKAAAGRSGGRCAARKCGARAGQSSTRAKGLAARGTQQRRAGVAPSIIAAPAARRREERANAPPPLRAKMTSPCERERRSYSGSPAPCPAPKGKFRALWQVTRRRRAPRGKGRMRGCRNLDFDAAQR